MRSPRQVIQLPTQLANQIAAGEVVARPASVVKELVENAVDAGASKVRIEIEGGGVSLVRVIDDGCGMSAEDAELAMSRHATSKIASVDDLQAIATFGFRGEALPSIAAVSRLTLRTRTADAEAGIEVRVEGGAEPQLAPCGCAPGTTVDVGDLFYNVPARRKFLRALATESAHITEVARALALSHPGVQVELVRDGRAAKRWLRAATIEDRVRNVLDDYELIACRGERGPIRLEAFLSRPERARAGAGGLCLFVAGRPVQDRALNRAVASAYGETLDRGRFPVGVVLIDMPLELVDVNVHPQKAEVRFAHARAVTDAVFSIISASLGAALDVPLRTGTTAHIQAPVQWKRPQPAGRDWHWSSDSGAVDATPPPPQPQPRRFDGAARTGDRPADLAPTGEHLATWRGRFLIVEVRCELWFVDGHRVRALQLRRRAAAERKRGRLSSQRLLFPINRRCSDAVGDAVAESNDALTNLGFELRRAGAQMLSLHAVPRLLASGPVEQLFEDVIAAFAADGAPAAIPDMGELLDALIARVTAADADSATDDPAAIVSELGEEALARATVMRVSYDELSRGAERS